MAITFNRKQEPVILTEGWHYARVNRISEGKPVNTVFGESSTVLIAFVTEDGGTATQSFLMAPGANELLVNLVAVTMGADTGEVDLEDLVGKYCGISVAHRYGQQDRLFVNVVDVCQANEFMDVGSEDDFPAVQEEELPIFGDTDI